MQKAQNIAKLLVMLTALLLLAGPRYAHAQTNTGAAPYLESEHTYQVQIGEEANNRMWIVTDDPATGSFPYEVAKANYPSNGYAWFEVITPATTDRDFEQVTIRFDSTIFDVGTYYLQYYEYDNDEGLCISARNFEITISENLFYLTLGDNFNQCNDESDSIHTYAEVDNVPDDGSEYFATEVEYTVTMHKETNYSPDTWEFDASFNQTVVTGSFSANVTTVGGGTALSTPDGGGYTVTVVGPNGGDDPFPDEVEVTITVSFENPVLTPALPELTVSNGMATVNGTPPAYTYDNTAIYPLAAPGDRQQEVTIYALPDTRDIGPGINETTWSTQNPLQYSRHDYVVEMGDMANFGTSGWYIDTLNGEAVPPANYVLSRNQSATCDTANITFNMGPGNYVLYFYETSDDGCTTFREYPFTLGDPFDVDLSASADQCADADGVVYELLDETETTIDYLVNLITEDYEAGWEFTFSVSSNPAFGADLDVTTMVVTNTATGDGTGITTSYTEGETSCSVEATSAVTGVTIAVTYNGLYANAHTITATLVDGTITGSFEETDADDGVTLDGGGTEGDINQSRHDIHAMPQAGTLAGVD